MCCSTNKIHISLVHRKHCFHSHGCREPMRCTLILLVGQLIFAVVAFLFYIRLLLGNVKYIVIHQIRSNTSQSSCCNRTMIALLSHFKLKSSHLMVFIVCILALIDSYISLLFRDSPRYRIT